MTRSRFALSLLVVLGILTLATALGQTGRGRELTTVLISNFPEVQQVTGEMTVTQPIPSALQVAIRGKVISPVDRHETTRLSQVGTIESKGFTHVQLSLHGQVRGKALKEGSVGVILVPDEPGVQAAFDEQGLIHFPLEAIALGIGNKTTYFASDQPLFTLAFERYRVFLYNETDRTVQADVFAYMTN